jgi:uncharacterized protein HemX
VAAVGLLGGQSDAADAQPNERRSQLKQLTGPTARMQRQHHQVEETGELLSRQAARIRSSFAALSSTGREPWRLSAMEMDSTARVIPLA